MGDASTPLTRAQARHLLRRTSFGALPDEVARITGRSRGVAVDDLLDFVPATVVLQGDDLGALRNDWLHYLLPRRRITRARDVTDYLPFSRHGLQEKLVLFWHDHFATDLAYPPGVAQQNQLLRTFCKGNFKAFIKAINKNPLMMSFLGTIRNFRFEPNENYARELMELFTLGVYDFAGNPNYRQQDIAQIARAFTGWRIDLQPLVAFLDGSEDCDGSGWHDYMTCYPDRGQKVIFEHTGGFGPAGRSFTINGEGAAEIDVVTDIIFEHRDTDNRNTVARFIARKLFTYFAHANPEAAAIDEIVATSGFDIDFELEPLLRAMFVHDAFYAGAASVADGAPRSVKWPLDFMLSTLRLLRVKLKSKYHYMVSGRSRYSIQGLLLDMGLALLKPPSVFGWDWEEAWLASSRLLARFRFIEQLIACRGVRPTALHPGRLIDLDLTEPGAIVDAVTDALGVIDDLTAAERQALIDYLGGSLNLRDRQIRESKLHGLIGLVLISPAYQVH